jgi:fructose-bisphosphate aldolase, class I
MLVTVATMFSLGTCSTNCAARYFAFAQFTEAARCGHWMQRLATAHLNAINRPPDAKPWKISFSYGRALQDPALETWHGRDENLAAGQEALYRRARCNGAASLGRYTDEMETASQSADDPPHRHDWRDD